MKMLVVMIIAVLMGAATAHSQTYTGTNMFLYGNDAGGQLSGDVSCDIMIGDRAGANLKKGSYLLRITLTHDSDAFGAAAALSKAMFLYRNEMDAECQDNYQKAMDKLVRMMRLALNAPKPKPANISVTFGGDGFSVDENGNRLSGYCPSGYQIASPLPPIIIGPYTYDCILESKGKTSFAGRLKRSR